MTGARNAVVDWERVDTALLDMDGTLLDLGFDNHFWQSVVPERWARRMGFPVQEGTERLAQLYADRRGTLEWYCIDHWSGELGLDIAGIKREFAGRIRFLPGAVAFLEFLRAMGKRLVLVTNAHETVLRIKLAQTDLGRYLDAVHSTHAFGLPKEHVAFWARLKLAEPFDPGRSVLVDDSPAVLRAARQFGIGQVCAITRPDPARPPLVVDGMASVESVADLI